MVIDKKRYMIEIQSLPKWRQEKIVNKNYLADLTYKHVQTTDIYETVYLAAAVQRTSIKSPS